MKREKTLQRGVCMAFSALFAAALCAAPLGVSANSALYEWQGSIAGGVTVQEENCPVVVERERLVFMVGELPQTEYPSADSFDEYGAHVTAEYDFTTPPTMTPP